MRLELTDLCHSFGDVPVLRNVTHTFTGGSLTAITGPSGSGKSTLLGLIAGWLDPTSGTIEATGVDRRAWVFQNPFGSPRRTALDHVVLPFLARSMERSEAEKEARHILRQFALGHVESSPMASLSGGEAQRLMFARAVATEPHLLLVDEPTAQLDAMSAKRVTDVMRALVETGRIVIVATHDRRVVDQCHSVVGLAD